MRIDRGALEAARHGVARSPHWESVRRDFVAKNPACVACGKGEDSHAGLQAHHLHPFHDVVLAGRPDLELDERNLRTLGEEEEDRPAADHHLLLGHDGDFRWENPNLDEDVKTYYGMTTDAIRADSAWQAGRASRTKSWPDMSPDERRAFRARLDGELPPDLELCERYGFVIAPYTG